jgi:hypothetical protein
MECPNPSQDGFAGGLQRGDSVSQMQFTVDHVMPQKLTPGWAVKISLTDHEKWVDTWANLVPLTLAANASKGQKDWSESKSVLEANSIYKTTNNLYHRYGDWTVVEIQNRAEELSNWAITRWPWYGELLEDSALAL